MNIRIRTLAGAAALAFSAQASALVMLGNFNFTGSPALEMDVNASTDRVYIAGGMGQSGLISINASNPGAMNQTSVGPGGGGVAVDPITGRFGTTQGSTFYMYNPNSTLHFSTGLTGCGGSVAQAGGHFGVSTQCIDTFRIYDQSGALLFNQAAGGVGSRVAANEATDTFYFRRDFGGGSINTVRVGPPYSSSTPLAQNGHVWGANSTTNRVYHQISSTQLDILDGNTHAIVNTVALTGGTSWLSISSLLNQWVVADGSSTLRVFDGISNSLLETFSMPTGWHPYMTDIADGDDRLYVVASHDSGAKGLFVFGMTAGVPLPGTLTLLFPGLLGLGALRRRRT
ncbi:MAG: YncE family protein [Betaproteobacteria bacterium]